MRDHPTSSNAAAHAAFVGWLPLIVVNAVFVRRMHGELTPRQTVSHHLYDAGQLLGLAVASWLVVRGLWRLPVRTRALTACALVAVASYGLLLGDLESFLERQGETVVPWRFLFSSAAAVGVVGSFAVGAALAHGVLRFAIGALGLTLAVGNHRVLELNYPGTHFLLAWTAACLIGTSALPWVSGPRAPAVMRAALIAAALLALPGYALVPGPVVRSALLGSSGAVAAPFVTRVWARLRDEGTVAIGEGQAAWFKPRQNLPAIPAERLAGAPAAPIVILLTVDAARSDVVEPPHASRKKVRNLLAMAENALTFERAWAPAAYTMASLRSLFLGMYYLQHGGGGPSDLRKRAGQREPVREQPYFPALLTQAGVTTANLRTHETFTRKGSICRGFSEEIVLAEKAPSAVVVNAVLERLGREPKSPLFLYSHMFDPHAPYDRGGTRGSEKQRYVAEISQVDAAIGTLRKELRKRGLERTTYLIVTSDHGEAFGEHGHYFHSTTMYEEMIRVPLLIEGPGIEPRRSRHAVTLIDLAPTILSLFGLPTPGYAMGQSLVPLMRGEDPPLSRPVAADGGRAIRAMLFDERWKAIVDVNRGTEELYDLKTDPGEQRNLAEQPGAGRYFATLRAFFAGLNPPAKK